MIHISKIESFKHKVSEAASRSIKVAENALKGSETLQKIVILKQTPRYDQESKDPFGMKHDLSILYNNTLEECLNKSLYRQKIYLGNHNLACHGAVREARFRHAQSGRFNGINMIGASGQKAYTLSVLNILRQAEVTSVRYNHRLKKAQSFSPFRDPAFMDTNLKEKESKVNSYSKDENKVTSHYNVDVQNRFDVFNQGN